MIQKEEVIQIANKLIDENIASLANNSVYEKEIALYEDKIKLNDNRLKKLTDIYLNNMIDIQEFSEKRKVIANDVNIINNKIRELKGLMYISNDTLESKLEDLKKIMNDNIYSSKENVSDKLIDSYIEKIVVYDDHFDWVLKGLGKSEEKQYLATIIIRKDEIQEFAQKYPDIKSSRTNKDIRVDIYLIINHCSLKIYYT